MGKKHKRSIAAMAEYVQELRKSLLLEHYTIHFAAEYPSVADAIADVQIMETRNVATIRLAKEFHTFTPEQQRHAMVHELLHIQLARYDYAVGDFEQHTDELSYRAVRRVVAREMELATDALTDVLAPMLPLPGGKR